MTNDEKYECALMALDAVGYTEKARAWFQKYRPDLLQKGDITTMQYSLTMRLRDKAMLLLTGSEQDQDRKVEQ